MRHDCPVKHGGAAHDELENSPRVSTYAGNARYDRAVANLKVAPVGSIGGNLHSADSHSDPAALLPAVARSKLCRKAGDGAAGDGSGGEGSAEAAGPIIGGTHPRFRASPAARGTGGVPLRGADRRGPDHLKRLAHVHSFRVLSEGCSVARTNV